MNFYLLLPESIYIIHQLYVLCLIIYLSIHPLHILLSVFYILSVYHLSVYNSIYFPQAFVYPVGIQQHILVKVLLITLHHPTKRSSREDAVEQLFPETVQLLNSTHTQRQEIFSPENVIELHRCLFIVPRLECLKKSRRSLPIHHSIQGEPCNFDSAVQLHVCYFSFIFFQFCFLILEY